MNQFSVYGFLFGYDIFLHSAITTGFFFLSEDLILVSDLQLHCNVWCVFVCLRGLSFLVGLSDVTALKALT